MRPCFTTVKTMGPVYVTSLSSGLQCAVLSTASAVSYCALSTLAGTRFEPPGLAGLAHFCEHMLFKETVRRKSYHINNRLERLGGEINAFTTKEELVLHATVLREDLGKALELMSDLVFHSVFPQNELIKERDVILDEIMSYKDSPMDLIYDSFEEKLFAGTPMATPILGIPGELRKITFQHMKQYLRERFIPQTMALTVVGNITPARAVLLAEKYFGSGAFSEKNPGPATVTVSAPLSQPASRFDITEKRGTYQTHCLTGSAAYGLHDKNRVPLVLLMNMIGGPASNARLNMLLREKYGLVYTVEASYAPYMDTGFAGIYFGTDGHNLSRCRELTEKVTTQYTKVPLTTLQLDRAKKQLIGQMSIAEDNHEVQCLSMGKSLLSFGKVFSHQEMISQIASVTSGQIMEVAREIWDTSRRGTLVYY